MRLAFLVCHLTGTGHLVRTLALARAARRMGHEAVVISGGRPLGHVDSGVPVVQLPPVTVRGFEFGVLRDPSGAPVAEGFMQSRRQAISDLVAAFRPDALVTELYPFGRRVLGPEFRHAIGAVREANPACAIIASVRDIPEPKPDRLARTAGLLAADYDGVLVHGDAAFLPLSTTWPLPEPASGLVHHTGYVRAGPPPRPGPRRDDVLVAVGGGVLGRRLLAIAAEAAALSARRWHLLVGGADAACIAAGLAEGAPANLTVEAARPDYRDLLAAAGCSVSLCGYNTAVELAGCTTPAILVPSEEADEKEQLIRARRLAGHAGFVLIRMESLTAENLAEAAETLAAGAPRPPVPLAGDDGSAAIAGIEAIIAEKSRR